MAEIFAHIGVTLSDELMAHALGQDSATSLLTLLSKLDEKAAGAHKENNMRISMIQDAINRQIREWDGKNANYLFQGLHTCLEVVMIMEMGDEGGVYEDIGFTYKGQATQITLDTPIDYKPIEISSSFGVLRRAEMYFIEQPGMNTKVIGEQPFIERSDEQASVEFAQEYYRYCCSPTDYPGSTIKREAIGDQEWFPITPKVLEQMEKKVGCKFSDLKIYKFFDREQMEYNHDIMPTHGLLCHMFLMCSLATAPFYLAGGHLGDPYKNQDQLEYYAQFLLHNDENTMPNRQGFIALLQILITILKNKKDHGSRLVQQEISVDELLPLMRAKNIGPFELYESLLRDQFRLVDNITTGDTIGFKLTGTGMMFLYMCCPKI